MSENTDTQNETVSTPPVEARVEGSPVAHFGGPLADGEVAPQASVPVLPPGVQLVEGGALVNGEFVSPATHVFRNGLPVLKVSGAPKRKPGPKTDGNAKPAETELPPEATVPATPPPVMPPEPTKVPLSVGTKDAVPAKASELESVAAMGISALAHSPAPVLPPKVQAPVTVEVARTYGKIGAPEAKTETLEIKTFAAPPANVELGYGLTLNIGNYESARVDVKVSVPCYREEVDDAYEWARAWAEERVRREVADIKGIAGSTKPNHF